MFHFAYDPEGRLHAEHVALSEVAAKVGTPAFVYVTATLRRHFRVFDDAFAGHRHLVCFSVKSNSNGAVLRVLAKDGAGADIVSGGELFRARRAGIPASRIVFSGVGKTEAEMAEALEAGILSFNVESEAELGVLSRVAAAAGRGAPVSLRVNPDVDAETHPYIATGLRESKFGIPIEDAERLARDVKTSPHLELVGVDCHIGSQLTRLEPLLEALESVLALADRLRGSGHRIEHIDLGGGLGIPYGEETPPHPSELGRRVVERMRGRSEMLVLEPGRVIAGNAGLLLCRVLYVKENGAKIFVVVDGAMNDLLRPSLYRAHHEIWPVEKRPGPERTVDVVGPVCESGDVFASGRRLRPVMAGDLLAVMGAGAYGFVMSSNYNSRVRAAEVLVDGGRFHVARARESREHLVNGESFPSWLE